MSRSQSGCSGSVLSSVPLKSPVTKSTLSELDVNKIVNNPKLRHDDINFDPDLHFRPNLDGEKGRRKTQRANWMRAQLKFYIISLEQFERELGDSEWCLPATLKVIRGILSSLVPKKDQSSLEEAFDIELLMQQFCKRVADLEKLTLWLSRLLKAHGTQIQDPLIDEMVSQLNDSHGRIGTEQLLCGLQNLPGVLEAMKLDVVKHQIRCLRQLLIEDTVGFEQKFFMKKYRMAKTPPHSRNISSCHQRIHARGFAHDSPESVVLESLYQSAAIPDQRQRLLSDPNLAYWSTVAGICSSFGGLLSYVLRHPNCIVIPLLGLIPYAGASPIRSTTPKSLNSELWYILQTFFQDYWDHLIGLPLLFFMLKFLDKCLFRNEDRSTPSAFTMVGIAIGLVYAGNAQDFEVSHVTLWSLLCVRVVTYYIGPTLRNLSLGRLWATLIVLPAIALAIGTAIICDVEEGRYANKYKFAVGLAIPYIAFSAYLWSALYDLWNYCYASGSDTSPTLNGQSSPPLELVRSIAAFCIGIFVTGPQPAPPTDLENGADMGASNMNTNTSNERHGPQVHSPTGQLPAAMPATPQNEQNTYPRRARRSRGRAHPRRPE